jgi:DHA3 family macrolide efflux protein-like MFS transporter
MGTVRTFYILTITQVLSLIGSGMTSVAVGIRVFADTGDTTPVLLAGFFAALPMMLAGSFAGVLVDRWERRRVLVLCDAGQAIGTLLLLASFLSGGFQLWHLYAVATVQGLLAMLQRPALEATVALLVPPAHLDRANVIRQLAGPAAGIIAPVLAGALYGLVGVPGVMAVDLATFAVAVAVVSRAHIPRPSRPEHGKARPSLWADYRSGLAFLWERPTLLYLMIYAAAINFLLAGPMSLTTPYVLTLTGSERALGLLLGPMNVGIVAGGVVMGAWGGTRPRIHGIMLGLLFRAAWLALYGVARTPLTLGLALFFVFFTNPLVDASFASLLQLKVPAALQGRVFALLFQLMYLTNPLSLLLTGPLVDRVLEPAVGGPRWEVAASLLGSAPGSGMGLLMLGAGALMFLLTALVYAHPATRRLERELPDQREAVAAG